MQICPSIPPEINVETAMLFFIAPGAKAKNNCGSKKKDKKRRKTLKINHHFSKSQTRSDGSPPATVLVDTPVGKDRKPG